MLHQLRLVRKSSEIQRALIKAPKGLLAMIQSVLIGFSEMPSSHQAQHTEELNELLAWITCAQHPLTPGEVDSILKCRDANGENWIRLEGELRGQLGSIF